MICDLILLLQKLLPASQRSGDSDDAFGSSYLHHRGLGVSDDVFGSSSWADHKLKVNQNFIFNVNKSIFRFWILTSRFPTLKYSELHFIHSNFWVVLHIVLLKETNKINSSLSYLRSQTCMQYVEFIVNTLNQAIRT